MTRLYVLILCGVALADNPEGKQGFVEDQVKFLKVGRDCFIFFYVKYIFLLFVEWQMMVLINEGALWLASYAPNILFTGMAPENNVQ